MLLLLSRRNYGLIKSGLEAAWWFGEGSGQVVADSGKATTPLQLGSTSGVDANDPAWITEGVDCGVDDYLIENGPAQLLGTHSEFTVTAVFDGRPPSATAVLVGATDNDLSGWEMSARGGDGTKMSSVFGNGAGLASFTSLASIDAGPDAWQCWTLTFDDAANVRKIFKNGVLDVNNGAAFSMSLPTTTPTVAKHAVFAAAYWATKIGFVGYWSRALSDAEIASNYTAIRRGLAPRGVTLP